MSHPAGALASAEAQVAAVRDDPAARLASMARLFLGPTGRAPQHLPFRRAALSFMRWQAKRGVLNPLDASPPGSVWWRAMNERLLRDGSEAVALLGGSAGEPSSQAVRLWLEFSETPTGVQWYRAHNASVVGGYLEHRDLAEREREAERFFMNVALARVLYAHALVGAPRLALGQVAPVGRLLGDPRFGMAGLFLSLRRVLPNRYPLTFVVEHYIADEQWLGRLLDYGVIVPRLQELYEWSARDLDAPRRACWSWSATAARSTPGPSSNDACGALRTCRSRPGHSSASRARVDERGGYRRAMPDEQIPVLVVGGSLVGLTTAMLLGHHGVPSISVERHAGTAIHPRAGHFQLRTMELLRQLGLEARVREKSLETYSPTGGIIAVESLAGRELATYVKELNEGVEGFSPTVRVFINQDALEPLLRERALGVVAWRARGSAGREEIARALATALKARLQPS
jgi:FAD binding domain-containing protein